MLRAMQIRAVIFDLFDTLVDLSLENVPRFTLAGRTMLGTQPALHEVATRHGEIDLETFVGELRATDRELHQSYQAVGRELPTRTRFGELTRRLGFGGDRLADALLETHMSSIRQHTRFLSHHREILSRLHSRHRIGVCSNFSHTPTALEMLEKSELRPHVDAVAISEEVGIRKPRPEIFRAILERLGVNADEAVHVGDRLEADVRGATELGVKTAWITRRVPDPAAALEAYEGPAPSWTIADLSELPSLLDGA